MANGMLPALALSVIVLAALVWLMYKSATSQEWAEVSQEERQARRKAEGRAK